MEFSNPSSWYVGWNEFISNFLETVSCSIFAPPIGKEEAVYSSQSAMNTTRPKNITITQSQKQRLVYLNSEKIVQSLSCVSQKLWIVQSVLLWMVLIVGGNSCMQLSKTTNLNRDNTLTRLTSLWKREKEKAIVVLLYIHKRQNLSEFPSLKIRIFLSSI